MKKDIPILRVEDLAVAIVPPTEGTPESELWDVFILNFRDVPIQNVLVSSHGFGEIEGREVETTTLRHFFDLIGPNQTEIIEPIQSELFGLTNEFWISFTLDGYMYDKKYVFVKGSISPEHFTHIPMIERKGVMIR